MRCLLVFDHFNICPCDIPLDSFSDLYMGRVRVDRLSNFPIQESDL